MKNEAASIMSELVKSTTGDNFFDAIKSNLLYEVCLSDAKALTYGEEINLYALIGKKDPVLIKVSDVAKYMKMTKEDVLEKVNSESVWVNVIYGEEKFECFWIKEIAELGICGCVGNEI